MIRIGSLFSGYGGLEQGVQAVLGGSVAWHSEIDPGACKILAHRYPDVPNLGDITTVDWAAVEPVDVLTGGFPCQDVSAAGKRLGIRPGTRSGLWAQFAYAIDQLRPGLVVIENVRGLLSAAAEHPAHGDLEPCPWCVGDDEPVTLRALGAVLGELADLGYDASWQGLRAADVGAPHGRFRVFVVAWPAADAGIFGRDGWPSVVGGRRDQAVGSEAGDHLGDSAGPSADAHRESGPGYRHSLAGDSAGTIRPGQAVPRRCGGAAAHADCDGLEGIGRELARERDAHGRGGAHGDGHAAERAATADAQRGRRAPANADARGALRAGSANEGGEPGTRRSASDTGRGGSVDWGAYASAIHRWERVLGRPAPAPTELNTKGSPRLSPRFVEWLMGLPAGWVTDVPGLSRNDQLKALGNGVVPQQATAALRLLLPDVMGAAA